MLHRIHQHLREAVRHDRQDGQLVATGPAQRAADRAPWARARRQVYPLFAQRLGQLIDGTWLIALPPILHPFDVFHPIRLRRLGLHRPLDPVLLYPLY